MLSLAKLGRGSEGYYLDAVAKGAEDYYVGRGEAPGYWAGRGADLLGLDGEVTPEVLRAILAGTAPYGSMLGAANRTVPGFDLTFSVPKSVSVLAALRPELSEQIVDACEIAVARSIAWLEDNACFSRRGHNGVEHVDGDGYVAAAFRHRTSRAGDPQLHWHVLVANTTRGPDGRWRTLDGTRIYPALRTAGFLFEAEMRHELTNRLGVQWRPARNGISEIDGAPAAVLRHFSKRRSQIEDRLAIKGYSSGRAAQVAALSTRDRKAGPESDQTLRERWQREAQSIGFDPASLGQLLDRPRRSFVLDDAVPAALSPKGLTHKKSTFTRLDALRDLAERATDGATIDEVERVTSRLLDDPEAVDLGVDTNGSEDVELRSGRRIGTVTRRYSTRELLALEQRIIDLSVRRSTTSRPHLLDSLTKVRLAGKHGPSNEQRAAVHRLLTGEKLVDSLIAAAGSGKTYSLNLAREMWEGSGYRVIGASLAARAAKELEDQAHIPSRTIAKLLIDLDRGTEQLDDKTVLVIDEAAMVGTRALAHLFDAADAGGSRLILVGDPHQLQSIEAGGVLRGLEKRMSTIGLTEIRRQRHAWERVALADLRAGEVGRFLTAYQAHGRIHIGDTADHAKQQLVSHWSTQLRFQRDVVILALRRDDVADLNRLARGKMLDGRRLGPEALIAGDREFGAGDRVVCLRNQRADGLLNGLRGVVTAIDPEARSLTVRLTDGTERTVPACYLVAGHLDHGYAMTIHKAQGLTADEALVFATDDLYQEAAYTALSRARLDTRVFVAAENFEDDPAVELIHPSFDRGPRPWDADLARSLSLSRSDGLAIDR
jgi:Ti-type conjugative transfer relaxase TraA